MGQYCTKCHFRDQCWVSLSSSEGSCPLLCWCLPHWSSLLCSLCLPSTFSSTNCQGDLNFLPADTSSPGSFTPEALPPAQIHTKVKRKEETMTFLYLPASLFTSDVNEALHGFLLSKHRCFCFMGLWDGMELINQSASAVPPHSCNFKARSHTKKGQKQNRQSLQRELR